MDDALLDVILGRIDGDTTLSEGATDLLLAACQSDDALADAVGGEPPPRPERRTAARPAAEPVGAFLSSITVEGFRGVGPAQTLALHPGHGLTVVVGRNGSGKSSFAEALEVLLTGTTARFQRHKVFKDGWRNLHQQHPSRVAAELHIEGAPGTTTVERTWPEGARVGVGDGVGTVQVAGEKVAGLDRLGWSDHLSTYRPFLSHSELEAMLASPSGLYDRLAAVLGLDDLTAAQDRLKAHHRTLSDEAKATEADRKNLLAELAELSAGNGDERAAQARDRLAASTPDIDALVRLATGSEPPAGGVLDVLRDLANLVTPDLAAIDTAGRRLRDAAAAVETVAGTEAARAKALADLLDRAVQLHDEHPADTACPVCGRVDVLDAGWRAYAADEITRLRAEAGAVERAHHEADAAIRAARALVRPQPPAVANGPAAGIDTAHLATVWKAWSATPPTRPDTTGRAAQARRSPGGLGRARRRRRARARRG